MSQQTIHEAIIKYRDTLRASIPDQLERLILFGSQATGDATTESDIDVLVVVNWETEQLPGGFYRAPFSDPRWHTIVDLAYDVSLDYDVYLSPLVMSEREFQVWSPLVNRVKTEGIEIWKRSAN